MENFKENPFFAAFYSNPTENAFETEITFLLQHYHQRKSLGAGAGGSIFDFSLLLDRAYAIVTLGRNDLEVFTSVYNSILTKIPTPTRIVRLECRPETQRNRIDRRGRTQEQMITLDYLARLEKAIDVVLLEQPYCDVPRINIDSEKIDFTEGASGVDLARNMILGESI